MTFLRKITNINCYANVKSLLTRKEILAAITDPELNRLATTNQMALGKALAIQILLDSPSVDIKHLIRTGLLAQSQVDILETTHANMLTTKASIKALAMKWITPEQVDAMPTPLHILELTKAYKNNPRLVDLIKPEDILTMRGEQITNYIQLVQAQHSIKTDLHITIKNCVP